MSDIFKESIIDKRCCYCGSYIAKIYPEAPDRSLCPECKDHGISHYQYKQLEAEIKDLKYRLELAAAWLNRDTPKNILKIIKGEK